MARKAFWTKFEGKEGSGMPIIARNDFAKGPGDVVHIQTMSQLGGDGVTGATTLAGSEEQLALGQFDLTVDWLRHAVAFTKRGLKRSNFDAMMAANGMLSSWGARRTDSDLFIEMISTVTPDILYANDATSDATLGTNDTFGTTEIDKLRVALLRKGALPISVVKKGKHEVPIYGVVISEMDEYNLIADAVWVETQQQIGARDETNPLITLALGMYHGMFIYVHHGMAGYQGTPLRPEASLYADHLTTETTTLTLGVNTNRDYTRFFPDSGTVKIVRASDGEEEFVSYASKTNNTLVITARGTSYGGVTPNAALDLVAGDLVTNLNHKSVQVAFGAEAAVRSWGQHFKPIHQEEDYGFEKGVGVEGIYGQDVIQDQAGTFPNYLIMHSYAANPNAGI